MTKREKGKREKKGIDRLKHLLVPKMKMKKLGKLLNYPSRLLLEKKKIELKTLKKQLKMFKKRKMIQTRKMILISDRILKSSQQVNKKMLEGIIQMTSTSEEK